MAPPVEGPCRSLPESTAPEDLPAEYIAWAYRLFLDREPESQAPLERMRKGLTSSQALRHTFMSCAEFNTKNSAHHPAAFASIPRRVHLDIERIEQSEFLANFFAHVKGTWSELGKVDAYWSVLSTNKFRDDQIADHIDEFCQSGRMECENLLALLNANGIEYKGRRCLEYGCGVGRVTRWLAEHFRQVSARDISSTHLELAIRHVNDAGCANVDFDLIRELADIENLPKSDFFYSMIVLQHNPPPIIEFIIKNLGLSLTRGGYGLFQVPTYRERYAFNLAAYLKQLQDGDSKHIEMHVLPMDRIFSAINESGCVPVQVFPDQWAGQDYESFSFLVRKS